LSIKYHDEVRRTGRGHLFFPIQGPAFHKRSGSLSYTFRKTRNWRQCFWCVVFGIICAETALLCLWGPDQIRVLFKHKADKQKKKSHKNHLVLFFFGNSVNVDTLINVVRSSQLFFTIGVETVGGQSRALITLGKLLIGLESNLAEVTATRREDPNKSIYSLINYICIVDLSGGFFFFESS
jgi:hypothetical protein